jgi:hypothetical protein
LSQTALTTVALKQDNYAVQAGDLTVAPVAMDATNGNSFIATGREILFFQNGDSAAHTVTVTSVADKLGRTDSSLASYSIPGNGFAFIQMKEINSWIQPGTNGAVYLATSSALVKVAVLQTN